MNKKREERGGRRPNQRRATTESAARRPLRLDDHYGQTASACHWGERESQMTSTTTTAGQSAASNVRRADVGLYSKDRTRRWRTEFRGGGKIRRKGGQQSRKRTKQVGKSTYVWVNESTRRGWVNGSTRRGSSESKSPKTAGYRSEGCTSQGGMHGCMMRDRRHELIRSRRVRRKPLVGLAGQRLLSMHRERLKGDERVG
ncbi:hypothetical protein K523DRAFT_150197 [Schizophyllum commune Tattone D]|nr:hypothetical protein K523DRAFT_150197 [Schizophyllum commune Tattone D]